MQATTVLDTATALKAARELSTQFAASAEHYDRTAEFPFANFERLFETGLLNLTVPKGYRGSGCGLGAAARVVSVIAEGEPSTALVLAMHLIYTGFPAVRDAWSHPGVDTIWRDSVECGGLVNVMRVEPELGTPSRGGLPGMTATPDGAGWRISGHKMYATGSPLLQNFVCWTRTAGESPQVGWFLVPRDVAGLRIVETWDHMGMRATGGHDLILEDVRVPAENALQVRAPAEWMPPDPVGGVWNNLVLAALYHGIARAAANWLRGYLHERMPTNLGASLATLPRFQTTVGEIETLLWTNERLVYGMADELDADGYAGPIAGQTALAKSVATNNAVRAVDLALGLIGNPGLARANPLERHHRDVLCSRIHMPQDDMVFVQAGRAALGIEQ